MFKHSLYLRMYVLAVLQSCINDGGYLEALDFVVHKTLSITSTPVLLFFVSILNLDFESLAGISYGH